ncbi:hypothetical protein BCR43DRAFT_565028 [Syncephalastrum racemosum]|uniref:Uncharacterized protein n=1 Tax=Syncephalastrum racemosum TaxID=13706 RepID=A0A1X2H897_SYNRA|nr:hypothetical protein BCR43DRAFT_565028 [Syncephalastrum racemosum]
MDEKVETTSFGDTMAETPVHVHKQEKKDIPANNSSPNSYKPLDEIDLTRDFRTSLILNEFQVNKNSNHEETPQPQPSPELSAPTVAGQAIVPEQRPMTQLTVSPQPEKLQLDDFEPLPVTSPVPASIEADGPAEIRENVTLPPLSPSSSSTSGDVRNSGGNNSSNTVDSPTAESEKVQHVEASNDASTSATPAPVPPNNDHNGPTTTNASTATPSSTGWRPLQAALSSFGSTRQSSRKKIRDPSERVDVRELPKGPPIIPRSKTPPPPPVLVVEKEKPAPTKKKNIHKGTIFDDDDPVTVEDFFFKDFSNERPKSRHISQYHQMTPEEKRQTRMSKFDLAAFAQHLHTHRLSMMQVRKSTVILNKEDELELEKLLEKRKSTMVQEDEGETSEPEPPLPAVPPLNSAGFKVEVIEPGTQYSSSASSSPVAPEPAHVASTPSRPMSKKPSLLLQKLNRSKSVETSDISLPRQRNANAGPSPSTSLQLKASTSDPIAFTAPRAAPFPPPSPATTVTPDTSGRPSLSSTRSSGSQEVTSSVARKSKHDSAEEPKTEARQERMRRVRKSMSMDEIHRIAQQKQHHHQQETSEVETMTVIPEDSDKAVENDGKLATPNPSVSTPATLLKPLSGLRKPRSTRQLSQLREEGEEDPKKTARGSRGIGLFGSLRQASRSQSSLRGLVRNLSNASYYRNSRPRTQSSTQLSNVTNAPADDSNLSPAARAVMQHNVKKDEKEAEQTQVIPSTRVSTEEPSEADEDTHASSSTPAPIGGMKLLSQLLAKANKPKRTKTVNMGAIESDMKLAPSTSTASTVRRERAKSRVVRRTIIYVPPDSLNFMKTLKQDQPGAPSAGLTTAPPLPTHTRETIRQLNRRDKRTFSSDKHSSSSDKQTLSSNESVPPSPPLEPAKSDMSLPDPSDEPANYYDDESLYDYYRNRDSVAPQPQLEGLELRELADGSVEWGIVKKQGNRKSFYVQSDEAFKQVEEEDEEQIEERVLALMGLAPSKEPPSSPLPPSPAVNGLTSASSMPPPVPRRSPRRQVDAQQAAQQQQQQQQQMMPIAANNDKKRARHISTITSRKDASTTDVYFAPQQTLPSLLQMIAHSNEEDRKQASVEEQLDEMMRSFQSH